MAVIITLPGLDGSDERHWQTLWEAADPSIRRFRPADWVRPDLDDWIAALDRAVAEAAEPPVLVAHSLACLLVPHWAARGGRARAAVLVAVPDPDGPDYPDFVRSFGGTPKGPLPFPSLVVTSEDDPFGSPSHARSQAADWGSEFVSVGFKGHINSDSGLGDWPEGKAILDRFCRSLAT